MKFRKSKYGPEPKGFSSMRQANGLLRWLRKQNIAFDIDNYFNYPYFSHNNKAPLSLYRHDSVYFLLQAGKEEIEIRVSDHAKGSHTGFDVLSIDPTTDLRYKDIIEYLKTKNLDKKENPKAKPGNFQLKSIAKKVPAEKAAHRFAALQRSGQYSELLFIQRGKSKVGWINRETPTRYEIAYKDGAQLKYVWRVKNKIKLMGKTNPCPSTANPPEPVKKAIQLSRDFHGIDPRYHKRRNIEWPKSLVKIGRCAQIDYVSPKWDGKSRQYFHKFGPGCQVYAGSWPQKTGENMLIVIGKFKVRPEGIVG